jgi:U3 small nucleolar RNA-associated protein 7
VLGIGHSHGFSTVVVPGAGEANFDSFESNPFIKSKQRNEAEIQSLLNKLSPDMIGLDFKFVGTVDQDIQALQE